MAFRYTSPPLTQSISTLVLIGGAVGLMQLPDVQAGWTAWVESTPAPVQLIATIWVLHQVVFWGMSAVFKFVEDHDKPAFIARYRIQPGPPKRPERSKVIANLALNQLVVVPLMLLGMWGALHLRGWEVDPLFPGPLEVVVHMVLLGVVSAIYFYASHRFLHRPWWMKHVHKKHHEYRTTAAWAAEYAHPVEMIFGNFGTLALGVLLISPNLATIYIYVIVATHTFVAHHSGFAVPWLSWAVHHDWHHYRYKEAFGTFGLLDKILGSDAEFRTLEDGDEVP